jgi:mannosyl-3-phosphoglycerate phosphatase
MQTIIFTDLDGTFLNHHDYTYDDASEALAKIRALKIPLIFTTSKTRAEVLELQKDVGIEEPFIVENGAAIFFPLSYDLSNFSDIVRFEEHQAVTVAKNYHNVWRLYDRYKERFGLRGLSDMHLSEVCALTGLEESRAKLAKHRDFTQPFVIDNEEQIEELRALAIEQEIKILQGGRFYHLVDIQQDKGVAVEKCMEIFSAIYKDEIFSIALGDSANDIDMLRVVNQPIVIQNHKGEYLQTDISGVGYSSFKGSRGFNEMVLKYVG